MTATNRETLKELLQQMSAGSKASKSLKGKEKESWLPVFLINPDDRTKGPNEPSFSTWVEAARGAVNVLQTELKKRYDIDVSPQEAFEYMAWAMEVTMTRLTWASGQDPMLYQCIASAAFDARQRYIATKTGVFPAPIGMRYESPEEMEEDLKSKEWSQPKAEARVKGSGLPEYTPGGYL